MDNNSLHIDQYAVIIKQLSEQFNVEPTLEAILFLIGIQELGRGLQEFNRDEKMDLIQLGTLRVLSEFEYYEKAGETDRDEWPIYQRNENLVLPEGSNQEEALKKGIVKYFLGNQDLLNN